MSKLIDVIQAFDLRKTTEKTIQTELGKIANVALNEGYFLVMLDEQSKKIYPVEVEFYIYGERESDQTEENKWMCDYNMYHRHYDKIDRKNPIDDKKNYVAYFPKSGSLFPHKSGVDVTFENEDEEYRASFLIKVYRVNDPKGSIERRATYLAEEMFGYAPFGTDVVSINIKWIDDPTVRTGLKEPDVRKNFHNKEGKQDEKKWRFIKADW